MNVENENEFFEQIVFNGQREDPEVICRSRVRVRDNNINMRPPP